MQRREKLTSDHPEQVNVSLEQVKMEDWCSSGQVKLVTVVLLVDKA